MLDSLHGTSDSLSILNSHQLNKNLRLHVHKLSPNKYYEQVFAVSDKDIPNQIVVIKKGAKYGASPIRFELNPSHFNNLGSLERLLSLVCHDPNSLRLKRLDHCVDVPIPIEKIHKCLALTSKRKREVYKGATITGAYFGSYPEVYIIYNKALQAKLPPPLTRIERRQFAKKIPIEYFGELEKLEAYTPFAPLKFLNPYNPKNKPKNEAKFLMLENAIEQLGLQATIKYFNQYSNFMRDFNVVLEPDKSIPDLDAIYQNQISKFFRSDNGNTEAIAS